MTGLVADPIAATTVTLSWTHLPDNQTNGDLFGYVVRVTANMLLSQTTSLDACLQENSAMMDRNISFLMEIIPCTNQTRPTLQVERIGEPDTHCTCSMLYIGKFSLLKIFRGYW